MQMAQRSPCWQHFGLCVLKGHYCGHHLMYNCHSSKWKAFLPRSPFGDLAPGRGPCRWRGARYVPRGHSTNARRAGFRVTKRAFTALTVFATTTREKPPEGHRQDRTHKPPGTQAHRIKQPLSQRVTYTFVTRPHSVTEQCATSYMTPSIPVLTFLASINFRFRIAIYIGEG